MPLVERDAHLQPLLTHWVSSRILPRTEAVHRMPVAVGPGWPGHGPTRVLSFGSPSGRRDQMTCIKRREFITLLGGVAARGALRNRNRVIEDVMSRIPDTCGFPEREFAARWQPKPCSPPVRGPANC